MPYYVAQIRQAQHLSLRKLAERAGVDRSSLSLWERELRRWPHADLLRCARALGVRLEDVWSEEPKGACTQGGWGWYCHCGGWRLLACTCGGWHSWRRIWACGVCTATGGVPEVPSPKNSPQRGAHAT